MGLLKHLLPSPFGPESPREIVSRKYRKYTGRRMNWERPADLNKKINWMKFYGDTSN